MRAFDELFFDEPPPVLASRQVQSRPIPEGTEAVRRGSWQRPASKKYKTDSRSLS